MPLLGVENATLAIEDYKRSQVKVDIITHLVDSMLGWQIVVLIQLINPHLVIAESTHLTNLIDVTLAVEDMDSELVSVVGEVDVGVELIVAYSLDTADKQAAA